MVRSDGSGHKAGWRWNWVKVQKEGAAKESQFDYYDWCKGEEVACTVPLLEVGFDTGAWVTDYPEMAFADKSVKSDIKVINNLRSSEPIYRKRTFKAKVRHQVQASRQVSTKAKISAGVKWTSPTTAAGKFSADFRSEWERAVQEAKAQLDEVELTWKETDRYRVPKRTLWIRQVFLESEWETGMLEAGLPMGVRWLKSVPVPAKERIATLRFGKTVPREWRAYIRKNFPEYVPPKLRNKKGPFKLRR